MTIARPVGFTIKETALVEAIKAGDSKSLEVCASLPTRERSIRLCHGIV